MSVSTKDKIIDASIDLFSENGYAETSIRDIASKVGIKASSIYYHFESKEAIFDYILNEYKNVVNESTHRRRWHEEKDIITADGSKMPIKEIMDLMFFRFEGPHSVQYRKMVKIICSEAVRNNVASDYLRQQNNESFRYVKSVLDSLLEAGKISKCDTARLAGILCSITLAFMHMDTIDMQSVSINGENTDMFSLLEYALKLGVGFP